MLMGFINQLVTGGGTILYWSNFFDSFASTVSPLLGVHRFLLWDIKIFVWEWTLNDGNYICFLIQYFFLASSWEGIRSWSIEKPHVKQPLSWTIWMQSIEQHFSCKTEHRFPNPSTKSRCFIDCPANILQLMKKSRIRPSILDKFHTFYRYSDIPIIFHTYFHVFPIFSNDLPILFSSSRRTGTAL
jgi:hypothetical protein